MKISIITVSYNSKETIERTIKSLQNQTYHNYEYILVDGASTDGTIEIIKKYEPQFEGRMKWVSEPDNGIYNAMNKGIKMSTGGIIGIVNSDDWLETDAIEEIVNLAKKSSNPNDIIYCGSLRFHYEDGTEQLMETDERRFNEGMKHGSMNHGAYHPSMFVGRNVYKKVGLFDEMFHVIADSDFIGRCYSNNVNFVFTKAVINNMSDGGASNKMNLKIRIPDHIYYCRKHGDGVFSTFYKTFLYLLKLLTKSIVGESLMKNYRNRHI